MEAPDLDPSAAREAIGARDRKLRCTAKLSLGPRLFEIAATAVDRVYLWACVSETRHIDGLRVGGDKLTPADWARLEAALALIKTHDRRRYDRLLHDLDRILVTLLPGPRGSHNPRISACELDERFILDPATSPETIATLIVHEVTHARLWHRGIGYEEAIRARVETICRMEELAFSARLPNGAPVHESTKRWLEEPPPSEFWVTTAMEERRLKGGVEGLQYLNAPRWLIWLVPYVFRLCHRRQRKPT